jgi:hypothetical protein
MLPWRRRADLPAALAQAGTAATSFHKECANGKTVAHPMSCPVWHILFTAIFRSTLR